jgi:NhaP-type Na+/H+ or K+/H+ antiporter
MRFALTGEAGLNDGSAFPFVMLGLGLLGLHELGDNGLQWLAVDVVYAVLGGIAIGGASGFLVGKLVLYLRRTHQEAVGLDEFIGLGLIALSYGVALAAHTYGFLAVFAAGLAVRWIERQTTGAEPDDPQVVERAHRVQQDVTEVATDPQRGPAYLASALLEFNEQLERIGEIALVVLVGAMLATVTLSWEAVAFAVLLFVAIRPLSVVVGLLGSGRPRQQVGLLAWFGIRGIGSLYYMSFAIAHADLPNVIGDRLASFVLTAVALSIVVHGISVTPLMDRYEGWRQGLQRRQEHRAAAAAPD